MKEPTLEVIHSAALNVTTNAQHQVFESMDEPTLVIFWEFFVMACGTFGKNILKWLNNICRQHIASNSKQQQLAPKRKRFRKESIWSARQAVDCQVRETYLTSEISVFLHDFSDQNVILCGEQLNGFHFGLYFYVSLDQQDSRIWVALRAAEWSFLLVLIFMCL